MHSRSTASGLISTKRILGFTHPTALQAKSINGRMGTAGGIHYVPSILHQSVTSMQL